MFIQNILAKLADGEADTPQLFSAVYTKRYIMKKVASRCPLDASTGRSMVEMLGVLAIIGVLSVGAIAGYSKAMMKYKLNKQAEQIGWLLNVMYRYRLAFGRSPKYMNLTPYFKKLGEIPDKLIKDDTDLLYDDFGSEIYISTNNCYENYTKCYDIILRYSISASESFEICQNIFNIVKEFHNEIYYTGVYQNLDNTGSYGKQYFGSKYCAQYGSCIKDITQQQIYEQCRHCENDATNCHLYFVFNIE